MPRRPRFREVQSGKSLAQRCAQSLIALGEARPHHATLGIPNWRRPLPGSGSSDWRPAGPAGGGDTCEVIEVTALNSPDKDVISGLSEGDVLGVRYEVGPPQRLVALKGSQVAGSITSPSMLQIIRCIRERDREYVAIVLNIRGAICQVRVQPK